MDVQGFGTSNGSNVQMWGCSANNNQRWQRHNDGTIRIYNGSKCLDVSKGNPNDNYGLGNGANVHIWDCYGNSNQRWNLQ